MKPTRRTQPYRAGGGRGASQVLEKMLAGGSKPTTRGAGANLAAGMRPKRGKARIYVPYR